MSGNFKWLERSEVMSNSMVSIWFDLYVATGTTEAGLITEDRAAHNTKALWRTEIQFKNGESAWLLPTKVSNFREASEFVLNLPCEHTEVIV